MEQDDGVINRSYYVFTPQESTLGDVDMLDHYSTTKLGIRKEFN